jgi:peptidoglycan/LPS O-acetylase OafA/YrhL
LADTVVVGHVTGRRADIQGLRAVAVLLVVVYHSGIGLPGGFVGVDVFFVISGFVITRMLVTELEERNRIDLKRFYLRRARRILPALALLLAVTLLLSVILVTMMLDADLAAG